MDVKEKLVELSDIQVLQREIECVKRKSYTNCTDCFNCDLLMTDERILSAYANAIAALQNPDGVTVQEWISVDDMLPEERGMYIVTANDGHAQRVSFVQWQKKNRMWNLTGARSYWRVTHWMPMPQPPEGE